MHRRAIILFLLALLGSGCHSIGPRQVATDRFDYSDSLAKSWKSQMLLNIIKVRYLDLPIFLDVGQVVSGYSLETSINLGATVSSIPVQSGSIGTAARYTDRPTITYMPLTGERFLQSFLSPIQPAKVFSLLQSGYPADFILELCLDSFNGLNNRPASLATTRQATPEFFEVLQLLKDIQDSGGIGLKVNTAADGDASTVFFFRADHVPAEIQAKAQKARSLLGIEPHTLQFELVYSPMPGQPGELSVGTRSLWQILAAMALGIEIPPSHLERQIAPPTQNPVSNPSLLHIHSGPHKPEDTFVAVQYEKEWFWIENRDWKSKRTFTSILFLFTLAESGGLEHLPTITIPAQ